MSCSTDLLVDTPNSTSTVRQSEVQLRGRRICARFSQPMDALRFIYESSIEDKQVNHSAGCLLSEKSAPSNVRTNGTGSSALHALHKLMRAHDYPKTPIILSSDSSIVKQSGMHGPQDGGASTCTESNTPNRTATMDMTRPLHNWAESEHTDTTTGGQITSTPDQLYRGYVVYLLTQQNKGNLDVVRSCVGSSCICNSGNSKSSIMCADTTAVDSTVYRSSMSSSFRRCGSSPGDVSVGERGGSIASAQTSQDDSCNTRSSASVSHSIATDLVLTSPSHADDTSGSNKSDSREDDDDLLYNSFCAPKEHTGIRSGSAGKHVVNTPTCATISFTHKDTSDAVSFILDVADTMSLWDSEGNMDPNKLWSPERGSVAAETISAMATSPGSTAASTPPISARNRTSTNASAHSAVNAAMQPLIQRYRRRCDLLHISQLPSVIRTLSFNTAVSVDGGAKLDGSLESTEACHHGVVGGVERGQLCATTHLRCTRPPVASAPAPMKINMSYCFGLGEVSSFISFLVILESTPQLRSLSLRHTELNSFCVRALALLIEARLLNLTFLDIRDNVHVDTMGGRAIQRLLKRRPTLRVVRVSNTSISPHVTKSIHRLVRQRSSRRTENIFS